MRIFADLIKTQTLMAYFTSQQEFDRQRNLLIGRQKTLSNYYSETSALVDDKPKNRRI